MDIVIYGIIGALAILVCWLLDIYSPTMEKESINMYSTEILGSEKTQVDQRQLFFPINDNYFSRYPTSEYLLPPLDVF
jgi:hypothetical protein